MTEEERFQAFAALVTAPRFTLADFLAAHRLGLESIQHTKLLKGETLKKTTIPEDVLAVLSSAELKPNGLKTNAHITAGQLDRKLYQKVNEVLEHLGGKWSRFDKAHVFQMTMGPLEEKLDAVITAGEFVNPSKNGYFPTPQALADHMVRQLQIKMGDAILEPSAGCGRLIDAVLRHTVNGGPKVDIIAVEKNKDLAMDMIRKYADEHNVGIIASDFMERFLDMDHEKGLFDKIIMNPPFEVRQDAKHVLRAFQLLKPGGILVSVMGAGVRFRQESEYRAVRSLIDEDGIMEQLPEGSFKESGTMVNTVLVTLRKS